MATRSKQSTPKGSRRTAVKTAGSPSGSAGMMKKFANAFQGVNTKLLNTAYKNARTFGGGPSWEPPQGNYVVEIAPGCEPRLVTPEGKDPFTVFDLNLVLKASTDPGVALDNVGLEGEDLTDKEYTHNIYLTVKEDKNGEPIIYGASEIKTILHLLYGADGGYGKDLQADCITLAQTEGRKLDVAIEEYSYESRDGQTRTGKNYYWNSAVD